MNKILINDNWEFMKLPQGVITSPAEPEQGYMPVSLPHTWYADDDQYRGLTVYRKCLKAEADWKQAYLEFQGADQNCKVLINGEAAGEHRGAYACFRVKVPEAALQSGLLNIEVYLDNSLNQGISPTFGDFTVFGGLYRDVNLLITEDEHFDYLYYGTDGVLARAAVAADGSGVLTIEPHAVAGPEAVTRYELCDAEGECIGTAEGDPDEVVRITVKQPHIWDGKKQPYLYQLKAVLISAGRCCDETCKQIGFRAIEMSAERGFSLNRNELRLCGVSRHQDTAESFSAVSDADIDRDFAMIDEIGANAVRLSHYQHSQYTYDLCDRDGYVVWAEIPMLKMTPDRELLDNAQLQLKELILQNLHHPSICFWGIQNEIAMFMDTEFMHEECQNLYETAKTLDPDRIITAANLFSVKPESKLNTITDMIGYNLYFGWYYGEMQDYNAYLDQLHEKCPGMPLGISEYGVDASPSLHSQTPQVKDYSEEYQALFHETVYPIFESKQYMWGSFVWSLFDFSSSRRDEGGRKYVNQKGLVSYDRSVKKDAFYYYKAKWSKEAFIHVCSKRFAKRSSEAITIKIYTNLDEVMLYRGTTLLGAGRNQGNGIVLFEAVALSAGENEFIVTGRDTAGSECSDRMVIERTEQPEPSYVLPDSGSGSTVKNWFLDEDTLVREGYFSLEDSAYDILQNNQAVAAVRKFMPELVEKLQGDVGIPLGFSLLRILSYDAKKTEGVDVQALNRMLNEVKKPI